MTASTGGRPRATVDTNLFVSAAIRAAGLPGQVLAAWRGDAFQLVTSAELDDEVADVFQRPELLRRFRIPPEQQHDLLSGLLAAEHVMPLYPLPLSVRDPKDEPLLACALGGRTNYLVTGDLDLLVLAGEPALGALRIVTPREFLGLLGVPLTG